MSADESEQHRLASICLFEHRKNQHTTSSQMDDKKEKKKTPETHKKS